MKVNHEGKKLRFYGFEENKISKFLHKVTQNSEISTFSTRLRLYSSYIIEQIGPRCYNISQKYGYQLLVNENGETFSFFEVHFWAQRIGGTKKVLIVKLSRGPRSIQKWSFYPREKIFETGPSPICS